MRCGSGSRSKMLRFVNKRPWADFRTVCTNRMGPPQTKLPEGNVFTGVCLFTRAGGGGVGRWHQMHGISHMVGHPKERSGKVDLLPLDQTSDLGIPSASDIWWWLLGTCSNLFIWGPLAKWHLVAATETEARTVSKRVVRILLAWCCHQVELSLCFLLLFRRRRRTTAKGAFILERKQKRRRFQSVALFPMCVYTTAMCKRQKIKEKIAFAFALVLI